MTMTIPERILVGLAGLLALALLVTGCAQPGTGNTRPAPGPLPLAASDARAIDAEAAAIRAGQHLPMPAPQAVAKDVGGSVSEVRSTNATRHRLELLYSGPTSQRLIVEPGANAAVRLLPGAYLVTARVSDPGANVMPFAGNRQLDAGVYTSRWEITATAAPAPKGRGLPLTATARQVRDWMARVQKSPQVRESYSDGGLGIENFMAQIEASARAQVVVGDASSQTGKCALLVVHGGELFPFERPATSDMKPPCRSAETSVSFGGAGAKLVRAQKIGSIQAFSIRSAQYVDPNRPVTAELRLFLDTVPTDRIAVRLTAMLSQSTLVMRSPPITLKRGENVVTQAFGPLQRNPLGAVMPNGSDVPEGPVIIVADITYADEGRSNQLLGNSAATLVNVGR